MSAASLASYVIRTLKSDETTTGDMSGRGGNSPTPQLTTVWRTKSIPYDIPNTNYPYRNEGSLLKLLRTKSMPLLGKEGSTPPRQLMVPSQSHSPSRNDSPSPVRRPLSRAVSDRETSNGHLSDGSESTVPSLATPPPTPRSPSPSRPRTRSNSDGHLWQRRKKQVRRHTDKAAVMLPSVKNLRGKFDEKAATSPGDQHPAAGPELEDANTQKENETGQEREGRRVIRHYSLLRREVKSPERMQPTKPAVTPANVKKILEKFETSPQKEEKEDTAGEVFLISDSQDMPSKSRSEVSLMTNTSEVLQQDGIRRRSLTSRHRMKNHRRSKSEPDPSAVLRHHSQTSPPSVKKLKLLFERESLGGGSDDFPMNTSPECSIPLERQKETTPERPQICESHKKTVKEMTALNSRIEDKLHLTVVNATESNQKGKTLPKVEVLAAGTPSVRSLRQRFEEGASAQSSLKTTGEEDVPRPRRAIVHHLVTPFEELPRQKSRSVSPEKESRKSLTSFSSASVKNLMRQFEAVSPGEIQQEQHDSLGHEPKPPFSLLPTDSHKKLQTYDNITSKAQQDTKFADKVEVEVEVDYNYRQESKRISSESSSDDEWKEEEGRRRRKEMERERERKEEENEKERQRIEQEQRLREKEENLKIEKDKEIIRKEKERAKQEREANEKEEKERKALEVLETEREAKKKLEERKVRERTEQERLAKEDEKMKEEISEQKKIEAERVELEKSKREKEEKDRKEIEREERRERAHQEKEIIEKAEKEQREQKNLEREKAQEDEKRKKREREEAERLNNEQEEEKRRKEEARSKREELIRRLSGKEMTQDVVSEEAYEHKNKPTDKPSDHKVNKMIDCFSHIGQHGDTLQPDSSNTPREEASSEPRVEQLIDQFTNLRDADLEGDAGRGDGHNRLDEDEHEDESREGRRYSEVAALVNKFRKLNVRRGSSSSSESDSESGKTRTKSVKEEAPIPTIPARSNVPGKVRTLREDEMRFFESASSGNTEPFMRTQSLRVKKNEQQHFSKPRFGSVRERNSNKSRVAVLSTSSTTTAALPRNCRRLNNDELQFFTGEVTNIYRNRTTKSRPRAGKTDRGKGRQPMVPRDNALPDTEEFFRIAGRADQGCDSNGRPTPSENDSDSDPSVLRSGDDVITDSESDTYELDINLRSDADISDHSDTEHHCNLDQTLSQFVYSIQGELLKPVATEDRKETQSRCYVVFSPEHYLFSSEEEDEMLEFPFSSSTLKENASTPELKENGISLAVTVQDLTLHDTSEETLILTPTSNTKTEPSDDKQNEGKDYTLQSMRLNYSGEDDAKSSQMMDSSQQSGVRNKENDSDIDFLGDTKLDFQALELKGLVLKTEETGETGSREDSTHLLTLKERNSNNEEKKVEEEEEVNVKKENQLESNGEELDPEELLLQEEQRAIAAFLDELDRLNSIPRIIPPISTRRKENPNKDMTDDDTSSVSNSDDDQEPEISAEDLRSIEEQIIPSAATKELLACPENRSDTPYYDDGSSDTTKDLTNTGIFSQDFTTSQETKEDFLITAPPSGTQESVPLINYNSALKKEEEEVEKEENHASPMSPHYSERQEEEECIDIREGSTVSREEADQNILLVTEEDNFITGWEFIKFCIFSLWFSLIIYFIADFLD